MGARRRTRRYEPDGDGDAGGLLTAGNSGEKEASAATRSLTKSGNLGGALGLSTWGFGRGTRCEYFDASDAPYIVEEVSKRRPTVLSCWIRTRASAKSPEEKGDDKGGPR